MAGLTMRLQFRGSSPERRVPYSWGGTPSWRRAALRCGIRVYSRECLILPECDQQAFKTICCVKQKFFLNTSL